LAVARGLTVYATGGSERGREMLLKEGAHHVFDHHSADYPQQILEATGGKGVDLILEMLANQNLAKDLSMLARHGRVVVIGSRGKIEIDPRETMGRDADIRGMTLWNVTEAQLHAIHSALYAGLENQTLRPIIQAEIPLAEAPRAHELVMEGNSHGKIVLIT
jgi:NADPH2:quinone reductase